MGTSVRHCVATAGLEMYATPRMAIVGLGVPRDGRDYSATKVMSSVTRVMSSMLEVIGVRSTVIKLMTSVNEVRSSVIGERSIV